MKMAFICFDQMTTLDLTGFSTAVSWIGIAKAKENVSWEFVAAKSVITDDRGMVIQIANVWPDLSQYDLIFIPGGMSTRHLQFNEEFIAWIKTAEAVKYKVSVCTGALLLGAAGFLKGKEATTNPSAYELLELYCAKVHPLRIVRDGDIFTAGGVSASIDLGLFLIESLISPEFAEATMKVMDYPYYQIGRWDSERNK